MTDTPSPVNVAAPVRRPERPGDLFRAFTRMSLMGFGGVLPIAQHELVERLQWLTRDEFVEMLSVGQVLPGPNVVNVALMVGDRFFGWRGAAAALGGMLGAPLLLVMTLAILYTGFAGHPLVAGALRGMGAVSAGLVLATALKLLPTLKKNPAGKPACALATLLTVAAIAWLRVPMVWVIALLGGSSVGYAWWALGRVRR
ncbi:chromate transporter [Aquincola sp. MAHUQ-54]|uniref:Chromate transporter n=1 Tax=Aquincola agrisoli TaxID=3119538 RepID=A0AAW9QPP1_9BURK